MTTPHPIHLPRAHRREAAESAGFDPHPDDRLPAAQHLLPADGVDVLAVFAAEVEAIRATFDKEVPSC